MNSQEHQSDLWKIQAENWRIQEATCKSLYQEIIKNLNLKAGNSILDIGCGTGYFLSLLHANDLLIYGIDISMNQIDYAKSSIPLGRFEVSSMEHLPFNNNQFEFVVSNNSFQYSTDFKQTLNEIHRILKTNGRLEISLWDEPQKSDSYAYFKVLYTLTNQDLNNSIPFNLSGNQQLTELLHNNGFIVDKLKTVQCERIYSNEEIAIRGILSSGPAKKAINASSIDLVSQQVKNAIKQYVNRRGEYRLINSYVFTIAKKK